MKNVFIEGNNIDDFKFYSKKGKGLNVEIIAQGLLVCDKAKNSGFFYGTEFSGFFIDFKTGKIGLKSLSGKGFFQGEVSEDVLLSKGYTKKTI